MTHLPHNIFLLANYTADDGGDGQEDVKHRGKNRGRKWTVAMETAAIYEVPLR